MTRGQHLPLALAASAAVHGAVLVYLVTRALTEVPATFGVLPVTLVALPGGGGGDGRPAAPPQSTSAARVPDTRPPVHVRKKTHTEEPTASAGAGGTGSEGTGGSGGDGSGGDGSGGALAAYGSNPHPPYPAAARRLRMEGRVVLEVTVAPDGHARAVRVAKSSGYLLLDESAASTIRERWRFVPARSGGVPIETEVTVPILFRLTGGDGRGPG